MHKTWKIVMIVCALLAFCAMSDCYAQVISIMCRSEPEELHYCYAKGYAHFAGSNFKTVTDKTINVSEDPLITLTNVKSNNAWLNGTLEYDTNKVPDGPYTINPHLKQGDPNDWSGTIVLGVLFPLQLYEKYGNWTPPADAYVTGQSTNTIYDGLVFTVYGKFNTDKEYQVYVYTEVFTKDPIPTCTVAETNATAVTCTFAGVTAFDWQWRFLVQEVESTSFLTMKNMLSNLISKPAPTTPEPEPQSLPVINNANGTCVLSSDACVDYANITFRGVQITPNAEDNYLVSIEKTDNGFCDVYNTTTTSMSCTLRNVNGRSKGSYLLTIQVREDDDTLSEKVIAGTLVLGGGKDVGGWSVNYVPSSGSNTITPKKIEESATVTTVLTIVFAIFFGITIIVMLIVFIRFKLITNKTWSAVKKQLQETQVEELRPRAAVHVKGEQPNN